MTVQLHVQIPLHGDPMSDWRHMRIALSEAMANASCSNHSEALRAVYDALRQSVPDDEPSIAEGNGDPMYGGKTTAGVSSSTRPDPDPYGSFVLPKQPPTPITGPGMMVSADALHDAAMRIATDLQKLADKGPTPAITAAYSAASLGWSRLALEMMGVAPAPVRDGSGAPQPKTDRNEVLNPHGDHAPVWVMAEDGMGTPLGYVHCGVRGRKQADNA